MPTPRHAVPLLAVLLAACASEPRPLLEGESFPVEQSFTVGTASDDVALRSDPPEPAEGDGAAAASDVVIECRLVELPERIAREALGVLAFAPGALAVDSRTLLARLETALRQDGVETLAAPRIVAHAGRRAHIQVVSQTAFIESFEGEAVRDAFIVDPIVSIAHGGMLLEVVADPDAGAVALDASLVIAYPPKPFTTVAVRLPVGGGALAERQSVTLQVPVFVSQRCATKARLRPGETLVISGLGAADGERALVVLLEAREVPAMAAAATGPDRTGAARERLAGSFPFLLPSEDSLRSCTDLRLRPW